MITVQVDIHRVFRILALFCAWHPLCHNSGICHCSFLMVYILMLMEHSEIEKSGVITGMAYSSGTGK